jgi:hypothetical protein
LEKCTRGYIRGYLLGGAGGEGAAGGASGAGGAGGVGGSGCASDAGGAGGAGLGDIQGDTLVDMYSSGCRLGVCARDTL